MEYTIHNLTELENFANLFVKEYLDKYKKVFFYGEMGAGKTSLIKIICKELGVDVHTSSPTFSLVNRYYIPSKSYAVNHADLYRLEHAEEAFNAGIYELMFDDDYFFVEWPEKIETYVGGALLKIHILVDEDESRHIKIESE